MKRHIEYLISVIVVLASSVICATAQPILVIGHKNPDADSIISAIALANLKTQQGIPATPLAQGTPNQETEFVLNACKLDPHRRQHECRRQEQDCRGKVRERIGEPEPGSRE